jgi:hypothetical protein
VDNKTDTQLHYLGPKPICCNTSNRKSHRTLSKALAMSNFMKIAGFFCSMKGSDQILSVEKIILYASLFDECALGSRV